MISDYQKSEADGEMLLRDYLENKILVSIIPVEQLPKDSQEKFNYDYLDIREYLQNLYLKGDEFEIEGFDSFIFHLIQKRRESLENLFYMGKIFARIKSPLVIYFTIYSNYSERRLKKNLKPLYPLKRDYGVNASYERKFFFRHFELKQYDYPIYFQEIDSLLNFFFDNAQKLVSIIKLDDCLDYHSKTVLYNKVSPDRYEETLKRGCRILSRGFDTVCWHIAITKNVPLILNTVEFVEQQLEAYQKLPKKEKEAPNTGGIFTFNIPKEIYDVLSNTAKDKQTQIDEVSKLVADANKPDIKTDTDDKAEEHYFKQQIEAIKYLIDTIGTIPNHFEEFETLFKRFDKYPELKKELVKSRKRQAHMVEEPEFIYSTRAEWNLNYFYDYGFADYETIEKLRFKDLSEREDVVYPNDDMSRKDYYRFSYRKAILQHCVQPERIEAKSERETSDQVREELGIPKVGEGWKNETFLYKLIYELMEPLGIEVIHHHKPDFLSRQELDIYFEIDGQEVGIEYQGIQHFEPVDYFGGEDAFKQTVKRDERKRRLCDENDVVLIYVNHWEVITQQFVLRRLKENGIEIKR